MSEEKMSQLMDYFIMKDFLMHNKWLPLDPRRQAMSDYQNDPAVQSRVNSIVENILRIMGGVDDGLHSEEDRK